MQKVKIKNFYVGENEKLCVISGPCVIESREHAFYCARELKKIFSKREMNFIFKASFDKANRSSIDSFRGPGMEEGLKILSEIKKELDLAVVTDFHLPEQAEMVGSVCDVLQIPAFLCRQTDMIASAAKTNLPLLIKKGQFMSPYDMKNIIEKAKFYKNESLILTERGVSFGYNTLIVDMTSFPIMKSLGFPVCFDATHSAQKPGSLGNATGGNREHIPTLTKAAIASGCNLLFLESHPEPQNAKSDSATVLGYDALKKLLDDVGKIYPLIQSLK